MQARITPNTETFYEMDYAESERFAVENLLWSQCFVIYIKFWERPIEVKY